MEARMKEGLSGWMTALPIGFSTMIIGGILDEKTYQRGSRCTYVSNREQ